VLIGLGAAGHRHDGYDTASSCHDAPMLSVERVTGSAELGEVTRRLLDALPDWFGIPEANDEYGASATRLPGYLARQDGEPIGVLLLNRHFPETAEIHLIAVAPAYHRQGVGRALVDAAEVDVRSTGARLLQVKTLGPSRPDPGYDNTRQFYLAAGFLRVEELLDLWEGYPCLVMVKPLS
jgi:GNAT superfamily N-acetyltransferase